MALVVFNSEGGEDSLEDAPESEIAELWPLVRVPDEVWLDRIPDGWSFASKLWGFGEGCASFNGARLDSIDSLTRGRLW